MAQETRTYVVNTTAFPTRIARQPRFRPASTWFLGCPRDGLSWLGSHHAPSGALCEPNLKGRLVARKTKLPLKLHGGRCRASDWRTQISGPEGRDVQHKCGYASITVPTVSPVRHGESTCGSARTPGRFSKTERLSRRAAVRAGKAVLDRSAELSPGRFGAEHASSPGKVAGTRVANDGNGRSARSRTSMARSPISRLCAHSSLVAECGCNRIGKGAEHPTKRNRTVDIMVQKLHT